MAVDWRVVVLSDIHLGSNPQAAVPNRLDALLELLRSLPGRCTHLVLAGDVFEFWMEYQHYISKHHFEFLRCLADLRDRGLEIHLLAGNHDFDLGVFFEKTLGLHVWHDGDLQLKVGDKTLCFAHGDGKAFSDKSYRMVRKIIRHRISGLLWRLIHPDWGMNLANAVGRLSRDAGESKSIPFAEYQSWADRELSHGADAVIHGHIHVPILEKRSAGLYACIGQWLFQCTWLEIDPRGIQLWEWSKGMRKEELWTR
jgi:UDP-2,3-diacylglucosamine hydrolase